MSISNKSDAAIISASVAYDNEFPLVLHMSSKCLLKLPEKNCFMKKNSAKLKQENTRIFRDNRTSCTKTSKNNTNSTQTKATSSYTADQM
jgi:hypothetical protein